MDQTTATATALPRLVEAMAFAAEAHSLQRRKDGLTPYINHPMALVRILAVEGGVDDVEVLCAAALHDYLEDCCGPGAEVPTHLAMSVEAGRARLLERFGPQVLSYVDAVSDDKSLAKAERKRLQVEHAAHVPHGAKLVKLADKIANLRDLHQAPPQDWSLARRQQYFDWAAQVIGQVRGAHPELERAFDAALARRPVSGA